MIDRHPWLSSLALCVVTALVVVGYIYFWTEVLKWQ